MLEEAEVGGAPRELAVPIQIAFEADQLNAQPGCNGAFGGYTIEDGRLTVSGPLAQTQMGCEDALLDQGSWFLRRWRPARWPASTATRSP